MRGLSLLDSVLLVVGGVIGGAIFLTPKDVAAQLSSPSLILFIWIAGGAIALLGCFAFAELGAMYPQAGGQYVYLREAYGEPAAFMYGWMMFIAGNTGGMAALAVSFAVYLAKVVPAFSATAPVFTLSAHARSFTLTRGDIVALSAVAILTLVNVMGLKRGAMLQNVATWIKFGAIAAFILFGFSVGHGSWSNFHSSGSLLTAASPNLRAALGVALIAVFWTYDGWVYASWVAGEIRQPERNIPRSLVIGVLCIIALYIGMNAAYLYAMPPAAMARSGTVAESAAALLFSSRAAYWLSLLIAISCFGALSSNILAAARVSYAMAIDGVFFRRMANVHPRWRTPVFALVAQGVWAAALTLSGRYDQLFTYTTFAMTLSYSVTVVALFILRRKHPEMPRPYRCTGYPWLPALYVLITGAWCVNTVVERPGEALASGLLVAIGLPGYWYWKRARD